MAVTLVQVILPALNAQRLRVSVQTVPQTVGTNSDDARTGAHARAPLHGSQDVGVWGCPCPVLSGETFLCVVVQLTHVVQDHSAEDDAAGACHRGDDSCEENAVPVLPPAECLLYKETCR